MKDRGLSLFGLKTLKDIEKVVQARPDVKFEISYNMSAQLISSAMPFLKERVLSLHACCPMTDTYPNFATKDDSVLELSFIAVRKSIETSVRLGARIMVLHPGYLTDKPVPLDTDERMTLLESEEFKKNTRGDGTNIAKPSYACEPEYRERMLLMRDNLAKVALMCKEEGITLGVENLNPRSGYLCLTPEDFEMLSQADDIHFTLDIGHLWITHFALEFDYLKAIRRMLETGRVVSCHLHGNPSDGKVMEDAHGLLMDYPLFPAKEAMDMVASYPVNLVLESISRPVESMKQLDWLLAKH